MGQVTGESSQRQRTCRAVAQVGDCGERLRRGTRRAVRLLWVPSEWGGCRVCPVNASHCTPKFHILHLLTFAPDTSI